MRYFWVLFLALSPVAAAQEPPASLRICAVQENDVDRLACYDKVSGRTPQMETGPAAAGKWKVEIETSSITDEKNVFVTIDSDDPVNCSWSRSSHVRLTLRCMENTTSLIFVTSCHMTASDYDNYGDVTIRIDDEKARVVPMSNSTNNSALGLWGGGKAIPEIKRMFGASKLVARMTPFGDSPFIVNFDIDGTEEAIKPLREACGW